MTNDKPVVLSVHRNTVEQRKRHATSEHLVKAARNMAAEKQVRGYAIVTWDKDCESIRTSFDPGPTMPDFAVPEFVRSILTHRISGDRE